MESGLPVYPFDPERCIGSIVEAGATYAKANLPQAATSDGRWVHGFRIGGGEVGEFVLIESGDIAVLGKIVMVTLPERDRMLLDKEFGRQPELHPRGTIQLLTTINIKSASVAGGISRHPRLGSKVYSAHPLVLKWMAEAAQSAAGTPPRVLLELGFLPSANGTAVSITPERLFGRHCAILGATGGGKSWSVGRLLEEIARHRGKAILLDATGEFHTLRTATAHVYLGHDPKPPASVSEVVWPYFELTEGDFLALLRPSGQTQAPKLRAAIRSLKLARLEPSLVTGGVIKKAGQPKSSYEAAYKKHVAVIEAPLADFDITRLSEQLYEECVWITGGASGRPDPTKWGNPNEQEKSYCVGLATRIDDMLHAKELACVFQPSAKPSLSRRISEFLDDKAASILRVSLRYLPFAHNAREIVANAIGRYVLGLARGGRFQQGPLLIVIDEAHQFLNKTLGDENSKFALDSFELIAKEGRKYSLIACLATQRPRDIPEGVLSQMGTMIVHRLTNDRDREVVERASGEIDQAASSFLPTLSPGQAIVIGVDFPIPLLINMYEPAQRPESHGPSFQTHWIRSPAE